MANNQY